jgi:hypothetical protein
LRLNKSAVSQTMFRKANNGRSGSQCSSARTGSFAAGHTLV